MYAQQNTSNSNYLLFKDDDKVTYFILFLEQK